MKINRGQFTLAKYPLTRFAPSVGNAGASPRVRRQ